MVILERQKGLLLRRGESAGTGGRSPCIHVWFQPDLSLKPIITLGLLPPFKTQVQISGASRFRGHPVGNSVLPARTGQKGQWGACAFPSLRSAIRGVPSNTSRFPLEPFHQHQPASLHMQDPLSVSILPSRGSPMQVSPAVPPGPWGTAG